MKIGYRDVRQMRTAVRRLSGHCSGGPTAVFDQSSDRMSEAISLEPGNTFLTAVADGVIRSLAKP